MRADAILLSSLLSLAGCTCASSHPVDAGVDASVVPDVPLDAPDDGGRDTPRLDAPLRAPICGEIVASSCPTQTADTVSACGPEGLVYFDGAHCRETPRDDCGAADRGAFSSYEECAVLCEAAGECDGSKIVYQPNGEAGGCSTDGLPPACAGGTSAWTEVDLGADCLFEQDYTCYPDARCSCSHASMQWDEQWRLFRRLSLLPFVERLDCQLPF